MATSVVWVMTSCRLAIGHQQFVLMLEQYVYVKHITLQQLKVTTNWSVLLLYTGSFLCFSVTNITCHSEYYPR